jgi:hypothetical protein
MLAAAACSALPADSFSDCVPSPSQYTRCKRSRDFFEKEKALDKDVRPKFMNLRSRKRPNIQVAADSRSGQIKTTSEKAWESKGSDSCAHEKRKSQCKECKGSQICFHGRRKHQCKECKGSQICVHERRKHQCKECKGSQICIHERRKHQCKDCREFKNKVHDRSRKDQVIARGLDSKHILVKVERSSGEAFRLLPNKGEARKDSPEAATRHPRHTPIYPPQSEPSSNHSSSPPHSRPTDNLFLLASVVCTSLHEEDGRGPG